MAGISFEEVGKNMGEGLKKVTKNKPLMIALIGGVVLVIFLAFRNRGTTTTENVTIPGGYAGIGTGEAGGGSGGGSSDDLSGALEGLQNNFTNMYNQQQQANQAALEQIAKNNAEQFNLLNQAIAGQQSYYDKLTGELRGNIEALNASIAQQQAEYAATISALQSQMQNSFGYSSGGSLAYAVGSSITEVPRGISAPIAVSPQSSGLASQQYGNASQQAKNEINSSSSYSDQTKNYTNNVISIGKTTTLEQVANTAERNQQQLASVQEKLKANPPKFKL